MSDPALIKLWGAIPRSVLEALDPEGDFGKKHMLNPEIFRLLGDVAGLRVLDAGAGQGYLARLLADRGAQVTACEPADGLFAYMREKEKARAQGICLLHLPLTELPERLEFDAVVCSMVLLAIPDWRPALTACVRALRPGGLLLVALNHPCFEGRRRDHDAGTNLPIYASEYVMDRPVAPDFHRTLSSYVNAVIGEGCDIVELVEPVLSAGIETSGDTARAREVPEYFLITARRR